MIRGGVHGEEVEACVHRSRTEARRGRYVHAAVQVDGGNDRQDRQVSVDERYDYEEWMNVR